MERSGLPRAGTPSWDELVRHRDRLVVLARRRVPDRADAEDCVHEALLRASTVPGVPPDRVGALLTTITVRLCVDWQRRHRVAARAVASYGGRREVAHDAMEAVEDRDAAAWLRRAVDDLGRTERAVVLARADGVSMSETATRLGISYKAAESALGRARRKLRFGLAALTGLTAWLRRPSVAVLGPAAVTVAIVAAVVVDPAGTHGPGEAAAPRASARPGLVVVEPVIRQVPEPTRSAAPAPAPTPGPVAVVVRPAAGGPADGSAAVGPLAIKSARPEDYDRQPEELAADCVQNGPLVDIDGPDWNLSCRRDGQGDFLGRTGRRTS